MIKVYLFWVLTALLIVFSSVLWCNRHTDLYRTHLEVTKIGALPYISASFGFPAPFFEINYVINATYFYYIMILRTTDFSLPYFTLDFLFYFVVLAVPFLSASEWITEREKKTTIE